MKQRKFYFWLSTALLLWVAAILLSPFFGSTEIHLAEIWNGTSRVDTEILLRTRIPRVLFAALVGGALAISGVAFQAILRNPLASPFTLGVSGGGSLGAAVAILLGWQTSIYSFSVLPLFSFLGALGIVLLVYGLSVASRQFSPLTLLLAGVVFNYVCASLILLVHYFADFTQSFILMRWIMGGLDVFDYGALLSLIPFLVVGTGLLFSQARGLNMISAGDEWAASRGIHVKRLISIEYFSASLLTGSVVAYCGPIGFVGLIIPHTIRLLVGPDHRLLLPVSFLMGGAFLVVCDTIARTVFAPSEIPVGIFTSILGGPFFLWLLLARKRELLF